MTEAEAIKFLSKCERFWLRQKGLRPGEIFSRSMDCYRSLLVSSSLLLFFSLANYAHEKGLWLWFHRFGVGFAFILIGVAMPLMIRLRQAGRALRAREAISRVRSEAFSMIFFGSTMVFMAGTNFVGHSTGFNLDVVIISFVLLILGLVNIGHGISTLIRLRVVRRALAHATEGSSRLSGPR